MHWHTAWAPRTRPPTPTPTNSDFKSPLAVSSHARAPPQVTPPVPAQVLLLLQRVSLGVVIDVLTRIGGIGGAYSTEVQYAGRHMPPRVQIQIEA